MTDETGPVDWRNDEGWEYEKEGYWREWEWDSMREAWVSVTYHRIYPRKDGTFLVSSADVWVTPEGGAKTFEEAERIALEIDE